MQPSDLDTARGSGRRRRPSTIVSPARRAAMVKTAEKWCGPDCPIASSCIAAIAVGLEWNSWYAGLTTRAGRSVPRPGSRSIDASTERDP